MVFLVFINGSIYALRRASAMENDSSMKTKFQNIVSSFLTPDLMVNDLLAKWGLNNEKETPQMEKGVSNEKKMDNSFSRFSPQKMILFRGFRKKKNIIFYFARRLDYIFGYKFGLFFSIEMWIVGLFVFIVFVLGTNTITIFRNQT